MQIKFEYDQRYYWDDLVDAERNQTQFVRNNFKRTQIVMAEYPREVCPKDTKFMIEPSRWDEELTVENAKELYFSNEEVINGEFTVLSQVLGEELHISMNFRNGKPLGVSYKNPEGSGILGFNISTLGELVEFLRKYE